MARTKKTTTGAKKTTTKKRTKVTKKEDEMLVQCSCCGNFKRRSDFFVSYSKLDKQGVTPYCKVCLKKMCNGEDNLPDINRTLQVLKKVDKPYIDRLWKMAMKDPNPNSIGNYIRMLNMNQYRFLTWEDGDAGSIEKIKAKPMDDIMPVETVIEKLDNFEVSDDIIKLFGAGYTKEEYFRMKEKYDFLSKQYNTQTNMHIEALLSYIRPKVKEEMAIAQGNTQEAKTWSEMAQKAGDRAKINPNQLSKADLQGGLNTIGEIALAAEQQADIIKVLPEFKFRPNDAVDFCIWEYINYARDLQGLPLLEYKDVYKFYDERKKHYLEQYGDPYGIFKDDPTESNRENIEKFINIPKDNEESEE